MLKLHSHFKCAHQINYDVIITSCIMDMGTITTTIASLDSFEAWI